MDELAALRQEGLERIRTAETLPDLDAVEVEYLGRKAGKVSGLMRNIGKLSAEERPAFGQRVNQLKDELTALLEARRVELQGADTERRLREEAVDVTRPGRVPAVGRRH